MIKQVYFGAMTNQHIVSLWVTLIFLVGCGGDGSGNAGTVTGKDTVADVQQTDVLEPGADTTESEDSGTVQDTAETPKDIELPDDVESSDTQAAEDVEPDTSPKTVDAGPPAAPPKAHPNGVMFRVDFVQVIEPGFCLKLPEKPDECADISNLINTYVGSHLDDSKNPMDIIGLFKPFDFDPAAFVEMSFGRGTCKRDADGTIEWCDFWGNPTFFEDTKMQPPGSCTMFTDGSGCYSTMEANMDLNLAGVPLGFKKAFTAGTFKFDDVPNPTGIAYGYVQGFMTEEVAKKTMVTADVLNGEIPLSDILDYGYITTNEEGDKGWFFKVDYQAKRVPIKF